jgi:superfamily II DNA or RNA helicase
MAIVHLRVKNTYTYYKIFGDSTYTPSMIQRLMNEKAIVKYTTFHKSNFTGTSAQEKQITLVDHEKLPTGLLHKIFEDFPDDIELDIKDERVEPQCEPYDHAFPFEFYDKQKEALEIGLSHRRGYFVIPTGGGKSALMFALAARLGGTSLIIEPSIDLVNQMQEDLEGVVDFKIDTVIGRDQLLEASSNIIVASEDTLMSNFMELVQSGWFAQFNNLFLDEAHHCNMTPDRTIKKKDENGKRYYEFKPQGFTSYYKLAMAIPAYNRFGFTATPGDSQVFIQAVTAGELIRITEDYLISIGRIAWQYVLFYYSKIPFYPEFEDAKKKNILDNQHRNDMIIKVCRYLESIGKSVLVIMDSKSRQLKYLKEHTNYPIATGDTEKEERREIYQKLASKEIKVLLSTVVKEGINIPSVDCVIRAAGNISDKKIIQEKGRGVRVTADKNSVLIIDFWDDDGSANKVRTPQGWRSKKGHLLKHSEERHAIYSSTRQNKIHFADNEGDFFSKIEDYFSDRIGGFFDER